MEVMYRCCAGLDVHKKLIVACVLGPKRSKEIRKFGTTTSELNGLAAWLQGKGCTHVAMESTGVYWKPVYNVLEDSCEVLLVNARALKIVPGRKTDVSDAEWIAQCLRHGLLKASFIPPRPIRQLRDLTRHRTRLVEQQTRIANRVQKVLEDANIKLASVATDVLGRSGRLMLEALSRGEEDSGQLADLALGKLKKKKPELRKALEGRVEEHHRFLLRELLDELDYLDRAIARVSERIQELSRPFEHAISLWDTIPGIDRHVAETLLAEIGADMSQFPSARHLASWAGICPGKNESAGKNRSGATRKGSRWLRRALAQAAWAAKRTKRSYFRAQYSRLAARRGKKRAIVAVGHTILVVAYHLLNENTPYSEVGEDFFDRLNKQHLTRTLVKRLERLGHKVTLQPAA